MEALSFNNILGEEDMDNLFADPEGGTEEETGEDTGSTQEDNKETDNNNTTTEVDPDDLFDEEEPDKPEGVGSETDDEGKGDPSPDGGGTSPNNLYSSIADALAEDGIFPNLDAETVKKVNDPETLSEVIEAEVMARLDEKQQRVTKALENGVEPTEIRRYESTLDFISKITEAQLSEEGDNGEELRRRLIYQDYLNRGYSPESAQKRTERSIDAGTDVEDAKDALQSNREYFQNAYNKLLEDAQKEAEKSKAEKQKQSEKLKKSIMEDKNLMGDLEIGADIRKKAYDNIMKPIYKDPETGTYMTALQRYQAEHAADFIKNIGLIFTLTNGFKDFDSFVKGKVKKEKKKGLEKLAQTLNNTRRSADGSLNLVTTAKEDPDSYWGKGLKLDI